jgi:hypothetical protein
VTDYVLHVSEDLVQQVTIEQVEANINSLLNSAATGAIDRWSVLQIVAGLVRTHIVPLVLPDDLSSRATHACFLIRDRVAAAGQIKEQSCMRR